MDISENSLISIIETQLDTLINNQRNGPFIDWEEWFIVFDELLETYNTQCAKIHPNMSNVYRKKAQILLYYDTN
jgi:hypothetical protein